VAFVACIASSTRSLRLLTCTSVGPSCRRRPRWSCSLLDPHLLAEHSERDVLELEAEVFRDRRAAGEDRDVLQHGLAAATEAGRRDDRDLEAAAQFIDDERRRRLALDVSAMMSNVLPDPGLEGGSSS
jgi:hypothetical protein